MERLPLDIVSCFLRFLKTKDILNLQECGNKALCLTLSRSVGELDLLRRRARPASFAPEFLFRFPVLHTLQIELNSQYRPAHDSGILLSSFPSSLRSLNVTLGRTNFFVMKSTDSSEVLVPGEFAAQVPQLTSLTISRKWQDSSTFVSSSANLVALLSGLPLTYLRVESFYLLPEFVSALPKTLLSARLDRFVKPEGPTRAKIILPTPNLTKLSLSGILSAILLTKMLTDPPPPHLLKINLHLIGGVPKSVIQRIPRGIASLSLFPMEVFDDSFAEVLPPNLTSLRINMGRFDTDAIEKLPMTLKIFGPPFNMHPEVPSWPPNLTKLNYEGQLPSHSWRILPRGLVSAGGEGIVVTKDDLPYLSHIPPTFQLLRLISPTIEMIKALPSHSSITELNMVGPFSVKTFSLICAFPSLVSLILEADVDFTILEDMNCRLRKFSIIGMGQETSNFLKLNLRAAWASRLEKLTYFRGSKNNGIAHYETENLESDEDVEAREMREKMEAEVIRRSLIDWVKTIPNTMRKLTLGNGDIPFEALAYLPASIEELSVFTDFYSFSFRNLSLLSPTIRTLSIDFITMNSDLLVTVKELCEAIPEKCQKFSIGALSAGENAVKLHNPEYWTAGCLLQPLLERRPFLEELSINSAVFNKSRNSCGSESIPEAFKRLKIAERAGILSTKLDYK